MRRIKGTLLLKLGLILQKNIYRAFTVYGIPFQGTSTYSVRMYPIQPTSTLHYCKAFGLSTYRFLSLIITASQLIPFLAVTKMLQFTALSFLAEIRAFLVQRLHATNQDLSQLATPIIDS